MREIKRESKRLASAICNIAETKADKEVMKRQSMSICTFRLQITGKKSFQSTSVPPSTVDSGRSTPNSRRGQKADIFVPEVASTSRRPTSTFYASQSRQKTLRQSWHRPATPPKHQMKKQPASVNQNTQPWIKAPATAFAEESTGHPSRAQSPDLL